MPALPLDAAGVFVAAAYGVFLALVVLGFNFLGDGLRDRFDPKLARK